MNLWLAIVLIVAIATLSGLYRERLKVQAARTDELSAKFEERIAKIESRLTNLETLVLENEKEKKYERL